MAREVARARKQAWAEGRGHSAQRPVAVSGDDDTITLDEHQATKRQVSASTERHAKAPQISMVSMTLGTNGGHDDDRTSVSGGAAARPRAAQAQAAQPKAAKQPKAAAQQPKAAAQQPTAVPCTAAWKDMNGTERGAASALGWGAQSWDRGDSVKAATMLFRRLAPQQAKVRPTRRLCQCRCGCGCGCRCRCLCARLLGARGAWRARPWPKPPSHALDERARARGWA